MHAHTYACSHEGRDPATPMYLINPCHMYCRHLSREGGLLSFMLEAPRYRTAKNKSLMTNSRPYLWVFTLIFPFFSLQPPSVPPPPSLSLSLHLAPFPFYCFFFSSLLHAIQKLKLKHLVRFGVRVVDWPVSFIVLCVVHCIVIMLLLSQKHPVLLAKK